MVEITERDDVDRGPDGADAVRVDEREAARKRVERKHKFSSDAVAYLVINLFLIGLWAATGFGYFWPGWVLAGWGVLLLLDAWSVHYRRSVTEDEIDEELRSRRALIELRVVSAREADAPWSGSDRASACSDREVGSDGRLDHDAPANSGRSGNWQS